MRFGSRAFLAGGLGFAAAFAVACGGQNGLLSSDQSDSISHQLDAISAAVSSGDCGAARRASARLNNEVAALTSVTTTLVQNLGQGANTLSQLAARDCSGTENRTTPTTTSTPTTTTAPATTATVTQTNTSPATTTAPPTHTATNPAGPGTTSAPSGGGALGTGTAGNGGNGQ